jgi:hypothetical protein
VYSKLLCGDRFALFRGNAATSDMSRLFESSPSIRDTFTRIGQESSALLVAFDDEQESLIGVWPHDGRRGACVVRGECHVVDDPMWNDVDLYCEAMLRGFDVGPHG